MKALITDHLISRIWVDIFSDHLEYELPQDKRDESDPITFQKCSANMTAKMGKYARYQLFYAISRDNYPTTINLMF